MSEALFIVKANAEAVEEDRLPDEELKAQLATLLFAASDTSTSGLLPHRSYCIELASFLSSIWGAGSNTACTVQPRGGAK